MFFKSQTKYSYLIPSRFVFYGVIWGNFDPLKIYSKLLHTYLHIFSSTKSIDSIFQKRYFMSFQAKGLQNCKLSKFVLFGKFCPLLLLSSGRFKWAHISWLCFFEHFIGPIEVIFQKKFWKFWKIEKYIFSIPTPKGPPFEKKIEKILKNDFFPKNHTFSTWIWILHILCFFWGK